MTTSDAGRVVVEAAGIFAACLALHVVVWRLWSIRTFRQWLPALALIFLGGGSWLAWVAASAAHPSGVVAGDTRGWHWLAVLSLHLPGSLVYIIGYTLISAFSPSVEILKLLDRQPGLRAEDIDLPYLRNIVGGDRLTNLVAEGMFVVNRDAVTLAPRAKQLARFVLAYRHVIGLPDGTGG